MLSGKPLVSDHMGSLYPALLDQVLTQGEPVSPRGELTLEVRPFIFQLTNPLNRWVPSKVRRANRAFAVVESFQFVLGVIDTGQQARYNKNILRWADPVTGEIEAPYGVRVRHQIIEVIELLNRDPDSRQAVASIYNGETDLRPMLNVPCSCLLQFFVRDGKVELTVYQRSNDLWWGTPYDVCQFTAMQEFVARALDRELGTYTHIAGSGHLYAPFVRKAKEVIAADPGWLPAQAEFFPRDLSCWEARGQLAKVLVFEARALGTLVEFSKLVGQLDQQLLSRAWHPTFREVAEWLVGVGRKKEEQRGHRDSAPWEPGGGAGSEDRGEHHAGRGDPAPDPQD